MKVFIAGKSPQEYVSDLEFNWCNVGEILMFGIFQKPTDNAMCGITTRKYTTYIIVKNMNISYDFFVELIADSLQNAFGCEFDDKGNFYVKIWKKFKFNLYEICNKLLDLAAPFEDGQIVKCIGTTIFPA